jgi:hypothetical protein
MDFEESYALRDESEAYRRRFSGESEALSVKNTRFWNDSSDATGT